MNRIIHICICMTLSASALFGACLFAAEAKEDKPNIVFIVTEDNCPALGSYGEKMANTPHMDALAAKGVRYSKAFSNSPVCAPSRCSLWNGITAQRLGTTFMRSSYPIPAEFRNFIGCLKDAGYYTIDMDKNDYNCSAGRVHGQNVIFDEVGGMFSANYLGKPLADDVVISGAKRPEGKPFFNQITVLPCHESNQNRLRGYIPSEEERASVEVPPYLVDNIETRNEIVRFHKSMTDADECVGKIMGALEKEGVAEDTIVFCFGDHGGNYPRGKRYIYDTGTHTQLIIYFPEKYAHLRPGKPGAVMDRLVSFIDFGPSALSLAGIPTPDYMEGTAYLGKYAGEPKDCVYQAVDRVDTPLLGARSIRTSKYDYIHYYQTQYTLWQRNDYPENCFPSVLEHREAYLNGEATAQQARFWEPPAVEELYDIEKDPWETNNLANDPAYADVLKAFRKQNYDRLLNAYDPCFLTEYEISERCAPRPGQTAYDLVRRPDFPYEALIETAELGSYGDPANLPLLSKRIKHREASVRYWAVNGLAILGQKAASEKEALLKLLRNDPSYQVQAGTAQALMRMGHYDEAAPFLIKQFSNEQGQRWQLAGGILLNEATRNPGCLAGFKNELTTVPIPHFRAMKPFNALVRLYSLPERDQNAAKRAARERQEK